jgi:hypothetical protein
LAQSDSEGAGAAAGGDLGWVEAGQLLTEIERVATKLNVGQVSEPVRTSLGIHLIKLEGREQGRALTLEEVRPKIKEELYARALEERFQTLLKSDLRKNHRVDVKIPGVVFRPEEKKDGTVKSLMAASSRKTPEKSLLSYLNPFSYVFSTAPPEGLEEDADYQIVSVFGVPLFKQETTDDNLPENPLATAPESAAPAADKNDSPGFFSSVLKTLNPFSSSR